MLSDLYAAKCCLGKGTATFTIGSVCMLTAPVLSAATFARPLLRPRLPLGLFPFPESEVVVSSFPFLHLQHNQSPHAEAGVCVVDAMHSRWGVDTT